MVIEDLVIVFWERRIVSVDRLVVGRVLAWSLEMCLDTVRNPLLRRAGSRDEVLFYGETICEQERKVQCIIWKFEILRCALLPCKLEVRYCHRRHRGRGRAFVTAASRFQGPVN